MLDRSGKTIWSNSGAGHPQARTHRSRRGLTAEKGRRTQRPAGNRRMLQCATKITQVGKMRSHVAVGEEVDHFHIDRLITSTPVASMFRAIDLKTQQPVTLKFPNPDVEADPVLANRFRREEEIGRTLSHPGLLKAVGESGQSRPYMVSEWFDGQLLRSLLNAEKKLTPDRAMKIALHVCDVLDYVENHGVFHRNIRPENIMVGADDNIKLINFGTSAMIGARRITFTNLSQAVGISDYIAPEELSGKRVDARSDVYSLGVVLYEMLT